MKALKDHGGKKLKWIQPKMLQRYYELRSEGDVYATLTWEKMFGSLAIGKCSEGEFSLKRGGFLHPYVTIRKRPFETDLAKLQLGLGDSGFLQVIDARRFSFEKLNFWKSNWGFIDSGGRMLCTITEKISLMKQGGEVEINVDVKTTKDLALLLIVGWYVITLRREEASAAGAAAVAHA